MSWHSFIHHVPLIIAWYFDMLSNKRVRQIFIRRRNPVVTTT
jgi:hypothetical protein